MKHWAAYLFAAMAAAVLWGCKGKSAQAVEAAVTQGVESAQEGPAADSAALVREMPEDIAGTDPDSLFIVADRMPAFRGGGIREFAAWIEAQTVYPEGLNRMCSPELLASFVIEADGRLTRPEVMAMPSDVAYPNVGLLVQEVERALRSSPRWTPGENDGGKVRVSMFMALPVRKK